MGNLRSRGVAAYLEKSNFSGEIPEVYSVRVRSVSSDNLIAFHKRYCDPFVRTVFFSDPSLMSPTLFVCGEGAKRSFYELPHDLSTTRLKFTGGG